MPAEPKSRRGLRLQFSLRALLVLMAVVGVAITIYRWPWVELSGALDSEGAIVDVSTTYRRGWNGKPLKHGRRVRELGSEPNHREEEYFLDDELYWHADYNVHGGQLRKHHYLGGKLHGPCSLWDGTIVGQYEHGIKAGKWIYTERNSVLEQMFASDEPHGTWRWLKDGKVTQTARFERGRLTEWNGRPFHDEWQRWLAANHVDTATRDMLASPLENVDFSVRWGRSDGENWWKLRDSNQEFVIRFDPPNSEEADDFVKSWLQEKPVVALSQAKPAAEPSRADSLGESILEHTLISGWGLKYHDGVPVIVRFWNAQPED